MPRNLNQACSSCLYLRILALRSLAPALRHYIKLLHELTVLARSLIINCFYFPHPFPACREKRGAHQTHLLSLRGRPLKSLLLRPLLRSLRNQRGGVRQSLQMKGFHLRCRSEISRGCGQTKHLEWRKSETPSFSREAPSDHWRVTPSAKAVTRLFAFSLRISSHSRTSIFFCACFGGPIPYRPPNHLLADFVSDTPYSQSRVPISSYDLHLHHHHQQQRPQRTEQQHLRLERRHLQ